VPIQVPDPYRGDALERWGSGTYFFLPTFVLVSTKTDTFQNRPFGMMKKDYEMGEELLG